MAGDYVRDLPLPVGTVASFTCHHDDPEVFFKFTSFLHPGTIFQCSFDSDAGMVSSSHCASGVKFADMWRPFGLDSSFLSHPTGAQAVL
jgi:hypothetical protein